MIIGGTPSRTMVRKRVSLGQYVGNIGLLSLIPMSRLRPDGRYELYQRPKSASRRSPGRLPLPATGHRRCELDGVRAILRAVPVVDATFLLSRVGFDICLPMAKVNKQNIFGSHDRLVQRALPGNLEG